MRRGNRMEEFKIKPELIEEWKKIAGENCTDAYSFGVVTATIAVFGGLDRGLSPKEANEAAYGMGISGFMAGCMAQYVSKFHIRGDEFRVFWNKEWGVTEETDGVVNPAIVTFKTKD